MRSFLALLVALAGGACAMTVAEARADADGDGVPDLIGQIVTIEAVATCEPTLFSSGSGVSFYVQDETAGINVFGWDLPAFEIGPGDLLAITGTMAQYNGLTEIEPGGSADYGYLGSPGAPDPWQLARHQGVSEELESMLLRGGNPATGQWVTVATQPALSGGGYNFEAWNGEVALAVRVNGSTGISVAGLEPGVRIFLTGIGGQYDSDPPYTSGYQVLPRYQSDIEIYTPSVPGYFHLEAAGTPFAPSIGEAMQIEYGGPDSMRFTLTVIDRAGREVARLADSRAGGDVLEWDGTDDYDQPLPMGPYILLLEGVDLDGERYTTTETVVVAAVLE